MLIPNSNSFIRQICSQFNSLSLTPEAWFREIKVAINYAHKLVRSLLQSMGSQLTKVLRDC